MPLVNQTARGVASISVMSAASLRSSLFSSSTTCCGAPSDGGGTKKRVPGPRPRWPAAAAGAAEVLAAVLAAAGHDPATVPAVTRAAATARRGMRPNG